MTNNNVVLSSLAMDLKRIALGLHRKSYSMADRFTKEAIVRKKETNTASLAPYMQSIMNKLTDVFADDDNERKAEDALMYSTLIQNYVMKEQVPS